MEYFKYFMVTGVAGQTIYDTGLTSSAEAPKRLKSILINVGIHDGNKIQGWLEREKVFEIPDYCIDTQEVVGAVTMPMSMNKINEIPVGVDMPVGTTFKVAVENTAGAVEHLYGAYRYEIVA
ncbi:hypothetical protein ES703_62150 [subsurface metagenome]